MFRLGSRLISTRRNKRTSYLVRSGTQGDSRKMAGVFEEGTPNGSLQVQHTDTEKQPGKGEELWADSGMDS